MTQAKLKEINQGWETYYSSANQDTLWKEDTEKFLLEHQNKIVENKKHCSILDIGCGDGRNSFAWLEKGHSVCCVDVAKSGLQKISQKATGRNFQQPILLCEDFLQTNLLPESFDVVQCFDALAQINDAKMAITKLCDMAKSNAYIIFNYFTPDDCAFGEGEQLDEQTFTYKNTLFKFMFEKEIIALLPPTVEIIVAETRRWDDPPHGDYRPYPHTHEAAFFLLRKK